MDKPFGRRLRALRQRAGLSATALAGDALSIATISRLEHGAIEPSLATLRYLAARLGCAPADLLRPERAAAPQALATVEACLLLDRPLQAGALAAQAIDRLDSEEDGDADAPQAARLRERLRWAAARAEAALEPARAPELLRAALAAATAAGDDWSLARLTVTWATQSTTEGMLPLLMAALARLPEAAADAPGHQLVRAQLRLLLARGQEREGARETAGGLYRQATVGAADLTQPERLAGALLLPIVTPRPAGTNPSSGPSDPTREDVPAILALAIVVAARRVWASAMLALARLDVRAHRLTAAAQRLGQVHAAGDFDVLASSEWSAAVAAAEQTGAGQPLTHTLEGARLDVVERQRALADLAVADGYLQAGKLDEAERLASVVATSLQATAPEAAGRIWLRLALAWADAGQAARAAQALRAAARP